MSEVGFSPGPWEIYEDDIDPHEVCIDAPSWGSLAKVVIRIEDEELYDSTGIANAHLIAAAPDLYEALEACLVLVTEREEQEGMESIPGYAARVSLAKARGETP